MFLKQIEIFGFKSFADRCRIDFSDGITALVGPNGCGKSNVVDAMKWVLGEQASKSLRAEKMEDVIFNGTESRKAQNIAEVALTFSNEQNHLPLDLPEVTIKRRIYRNGDSEYFINSAPVKLKEVRELFYDTGVGKSAYSIMEQGRIDQILSNKPEERRYIFEEAAGITKYKIRGAEAHRKLEKTDENIRQVESILSEVKRSYETLKSQSEKTGQYRSLRKEIFEVEKNIQLLRLKSFNVQKETVKEKLGIQTEKRNALRLEIDQINSTVENSLEAVSLMEKNLIETQKMIYSLQLEQSQSDSQEKLLVERRSVLSEQILISRQKIETLELKVIHIQQEQEKKALEKAEIEKRTEEAAQNILEFETNIENANQRILANEESVKQKEERGRLLGLEQIEHQKNLRELTDQLVSELDSQLKEQGFQWEDLKGLDSDLSLGQEALTIFIKGKQDIFSDIIKTKKFPHNDPVVFLESLNLDFQTAEITLKNLGTAVARLRGSVPSFLNDFLSPKGIITKKREVESLIDRKSQEVVDLRAQIQGLTEENARLRTQIDEYRKSLEELKLSKERMSGQKLALEETIQRLNREKGEQAINLDQTTKDLEDANRRVQALEVDLNKLGELKKDFVAREETLKAQSGALEKEISEKSLALQTREKDLRSKNENLTQLQGQVESLQMETAQIHTEIKNLYDNFRDKHSVDLADFEKEFDQISAPTKDLKEVMNQKKEDLKNLGQVNLMAPEEFAEVSERYNFLSGQLGDLRKAKDDLHQVTKEIRKESTALFLAAFEEIKKNFNTIFRRLFGGGRAELKLLDLENVLDSGIEMYCQPPGKKLENINLLSGGEKSMTAVGLLFATFMVKPSPFCVLDEIDAALDESNVGRFVHMLMEFGEHSQFVVITHNKKTMIGAKTMIGVTMEESGISKVMSVRVQNSSQEA